MLDVCGLTAGYGKKEVLHHLSVSLEAGKLTAIIGPNGCGKSTLLKAVLGLIPRAEGEVVLDGVSFSTLRRQEIARRIAYLAQGASIPDMIVEELVLRGRFPYLSYPRGYTQKDRELARLAMERVGIAALAREPMSALSGGLRQTAYIAMALAQGTDSILLDEPTTYLDVAHQLALMKLLRQLSAEGRGDHGGDARSAPGAELCGHGGRDGGREDRYGRNTPGDCGERCDWDGVWSGGYADGRGVLVSDEIKRGLGQCPNLMSRNRDSGPRRTSRVPRSCRHQIALRPVGRWKAESFYLLAT